VSRACLGRDDEKIRHVTRVASRVVLPRGTIPAAYGLPHLHRAASRRYTRRDPSLSLLALSLSFSLSVSRSRCAPRARACVHKHKCTYTIHGGSHLPFPKSPHWHPSRDLRNPPSGSFLPSLISGVETTHAIFAAKEGECAF